MERRERGEDELSININNKLPDANEHNPRVLLLFEGEARLRVTSKVRGSERLEIVRTKCMHSGCIVHT